MGQNILTWGFPFYLVILEMIFRAVSGLDTTIFIGSAIATAGLSFMIPLTRPKNAYDLVDDSIAKLILESGADVVSSRDQQLIPLIWISILVGFLIWFFASHIALTEPTSKIFFMPKHMAIGLINYLLAAIFTAIKRKI